MDELLNVAPQSALKTEALKPEGSTTFKLAVAFDEPELVNVNVAPSCPPTLGDVLAKVRAAA